MCGQPLAVPERDELVLSPVHQQNRNGDLGQPEPPRAELGAAVISPSLAAGRETLVSGVREMLGSAFQDGQVCGYQQRLQRLDKIACRRGQEHFPVLARLGPRRVRVFEIQPEVIDVVLANAGEPIKPFSAVRRRRRERARWPPLQDRARPEN
jgi:hypothetical protein